MRVVPVVTEELISGESLIVGALRTYWPPPHAIRVAWAPLAIVLAGNVKEKVFSKKNPYVLGGA